MARGKILDLSNMEKYRDAKKKKKAESKADPELKRPRAKRVAKMVALQFMQNGSFKFTEEQLSNIAAFYRPDNENPVARLLRLMRRVEFKKMVEDNLIEIFKEKGWKNKDIVEKFEKIFNIAEDIKNPIAMLKTMDLVLELMDKKPKKITMTQETSYLPEGIKDLAGIAEVERLDD